MSKQVTLKKFFGNSITCHNASVSLPSFSLNDWVKSLSDNERDLLKLEIDTLHESWLRVLKDEIRKPYFLKLKKYLQLEKKSFTIYPQERDIYSWSKHSPLDQVKVVILGQDPYHNHGQAHGLCFSVQDGIIPPPSLKNIFKALKFDYPDFCEPKSGSLSSWADQGVLLLNACLTVRAHQANSHSNQGWEQFTSKILQIVCDTRKSGVVFLAWGTPAAKRLLGLDISNHLVLKSVHPSPLSAARGFFDCGHFKKTNNWLASKYGASSVINWNSLAFATKSDDTIKTNNAKKTFVKAQITSVEAQNSTIEAQNTSVDNNNTAEYTKNTMISTNNSLKRQSKSLENNFKKSKFDTDS